MKKIMIILFLVITLFITGCKKKEEKEAGDINFNKNSETLTDEINYEINGIGLYIKSEYEGMPYNDSLFSYMINDENGMFIVEYKDIDNKEIDVDGLNQYSINEKKYYYQYDNDVLNIYYFIDNENYLYIAIENLNNEFNDNNILFLFNQLYFEIG